MINNFLLNFKMANLQLSKINKICSLIFKINKEIINKVYQISKLNLINKTLKMQIIKIQST
jgi:hypothetical protein